MLEPSRDTCVAKVNALHSAVVARLEWYATEHKIIFDNIDLIRLVNDKSPFKYMAHCIDVDRVERHMGSGEYTIRRMATSSLGHLQLSQPDCG